MGYISLQFFQQCVRFPVALPYSPTLVCSVLFICFIFTHSCKCIVLIAFPYSIVISLMPNNAEHFDVFLFSLQFYFVVV